MSRIHEALRKAELEGKTLTALSDQSSAERQPDIPAKGEEVAKLGDMVLSPPLDTSAPGVSVRFEDIKKRCVQVNWRPDPQTDVFANTGLGLEAAEQFRTLRSRLYHLQTEKQLRAILVTSPVSGDGKSFVAVNLARAIVRQADRRVLLIDADLRSSFLHIPLGAPFHLGLSEYLAGSADELTVIQHGQEGGLYFVAAGKPVSNASELLSNARLKALMERTAPCFDWVIIDSPPCLRVADASLIAGLCDGTLLVVRSGSTPSSAAQKAFRELRKTNVIGIVLNGVNEKTLTYDSYYGRGQYGHAASNDFSK